MNMPNNPPPNTNRAPSVAPVVAAPNATATTWRMRGDTYMLVELLHLFQVMGYVLPIGSMEWDMVLKGRSENYSGRDIYSLWRKYTATHQNKTLTCDPNMPAEMRLSKQVEYLIGDKAELGDATWQFDMDDEGESEEEEAVAQEIF